MPRNFYRRVEVMFPIEAPELKQRILNEIIPTYLRDNTRARMLQTDGSYTRVQPAAGRSAASLPGRIPGNARRAAEPSQRRQRRGKRRRRTASAHRAALAATVKAAVARRVT